MQIFWQKNEKFFQQPKFCPPRPRNCMAIRGYKQSEFCNAFFCPKSCKCQKLFILLHSPSRSARRSHRMALGAIKATPASASPHHKHCVGLCRGPLGKHCLQPLAWFASGTPLSAKHCVGLCRGPHYLRNTALVCVGDPGYSKAVIH